MNRVESRRDERMEVHARNSSLLNRFFNHSVWGPAGARVWWLIPTFGLLLIGLLWLAAIARLTNERALIQDAAKQAIEGVASTFEQRTLRTIQNADATALILKHLYEHGSGAINIPSAVADGLIPPNAYRVVSIVDRSGLVTASSDASSVGLQVGDRDNFQRHVAVDTGVLYISRPTRLRANGLPAIPLTRRLNHPDGSFAGIVFLSVDPDFFTDNYTQAALGREGTLELLGTDDVYRAYRTGMSRASAPETDGRNIVTQALAMPVGTFEGRSPVDGAMRIVAYRKLHDLPLIVIASRSEAEVLAEFNERRDIYFWTTGLASLGVLLFFAVISALAWTLKESRRRAWNRAGELKLASKVYETTADGIMLSDRDDRIIMVNAAFSKLIGYSAEEVIGHVARESPLRPGDIENFDGRMETLRREGSFTGEVTRCRKDGKALSLWLTATCVPDIHGKLSHYIRVFTDISLLKETQHKLERLASFDTLTGLPNRRLFQDRLEQALLGAERHRTTMALMFVDLDGFKEVNDTLGHDVGDLLLREAALRLEQCVRANDTVGRFGGDEFAVILQDTSLPMDAEVIGNRIVMALAEPFDLDGHRLRISASLGIARYPTDGTDATALLKSADVAMYTAKRLGRNRLAFYHHEIQPTPANL